MHFSRCAAWYFTSTKEYTRSAFIKKSETFKSFEDANTQGKSFMVLGSTGTIGAAVSKYLAKKEGITLYLLYNDDKRGDELIAKLKQTTGKDTNIIPQKLDHTNVSKVREFVDEFINSKKNLHVLVKASEKDELGTEKTFLVNVISPYIIITKFAEYMSSTTDPTFKKRIINGTCGFILTVNVRPIDIELKKIQLKPLFSYSHEKKQNAIMINFLATKYPNIHFANVIPGWVESTNTKQILPDITKSLMHDLRTPEQAADTLLWASLSDEALTFKSGEVFIDRGLYKLSYMNQPAMVKKAVITLYLKQLQQVISKYDNYQRGDKINSKGIEIVKPQETDTKKES